VTAKGTGLRWPDLDEDLSVAEIIGVDEDDLLRLAGFVEESAPRRPLWLGTRAGLRRQQLDDAAYTGSMTQERLVISQQPGSSVDVGVQQSIVSFSAALSGESIMVVRINAGLDPAVSVTAAPLSATVRLS
jgi:hypothetical protein